MLVVIRSNGYVIGRSLSFRKTNDKYFYRKVIFSKVILFANDISQAIDINNLISY